MGAPEKTDVKVLIDGERFPLLAAHLRNIPRRAWAEQLRMLAETQIIMRRAMVEGRSLTADPDSIHTPDDHSGLDSRKSALLRAVMQSEFNEEVNS